MIRKMMIVFSVMFLLMSFVALGGTAFAASAPAHSSPVVDFAALLTFT